MAHIYRKRVQERLGITILSSTEFESTLTVDWSVLGAAGMSCTCTLYRPCHLGVSSFVGALFAG